MTEIPKKVDTKKLQFDLTTAELAGFFGVKPLTVSSWRRANKFPHAYKKNGRWYYPREDVTEFVNAKYGDDDPVIGV